MSNRTKASLVCLLALLAFACSDNSMKNTPMPSMATDKDCAPTDMQAPSLCDWAQSVDAVVWGTLTDFRLVETPGVTTNEAGKHVLVQECSKGVIDRAMVFEVSVETTLWGSPPDRLTAHIGVDHVSLFAPFPAKSQDGGIRWDTRGALDGQALQKGQRIGLALHYLEEHDLWTLAMEPMFGVGDGKIVFQKSLGECVEDSPALQGAVSYSDFVDAIGDCDTTPSVEAEARTKHRESYRTNPLWSFATYCQPDTEWVDGVDCNDNADCSDDDVEMICVDGKCQAQ